VVNRAFVAIRRSQAARAGLLAQCRLTAASTGLAIVTSPVISGL
jgi:hypothetical protein